MADEDSESNEPIVEISGETITGNEHARPLNRAERRAQEHHKKAGTKPGIGGGMGAQNVGKFTRGASGGKGNTALPRTGHK